MRILPCQVGSAWLVGMVIAAGFGVLLVLPQQAGAVTFFSDSFDPAPMPGWTTSGAWHLANETADPCFGTSPPNQPGASASSPNSFGYHYDTATPAMSGQACTYDLDDGAGSSAPNTGQLISPPIGSPFTRKSISARWLPLTANVCLSYSPSQMSRRVLLSA